MMSNSAVGTTVLLKPDESGVNSREITGEQFRIETLERKMRSIEIRLTKLEQLSQDGWNSK